MVVSTSSGPRTRAPTSSIALPTRPLSSARTPVSSRFFLARSSTPRASSTDAWACFTWVTACSCFEMALSRSNADIRARTCSALACRASASFSRARAARQSAS